MAYSEITSRKNEKAAHIKKLASSASYRRERGEFFADGEKLLHEAVMWGVEIRDVFFSGDEPDFLPANVKKYRVPQAIIEYISPMQTPQTVAFSAKIPDKNDKPGLSGSVILENIQDPGNAGTMIRTANAFGIKSVLLLGACADVWSPKTIRASMGAVFRENVSAISYDELNALKAGGAKLYGAALSDKSADVRSCDLNNAAVAIGNEGSGLTKTLIDMCDGEIIIPMNSQCESLNAAAAAAVIMWEMARERL